MNTETVVLKNGVHISFEKLTEVQTCSIGVFVANGSRHEDEAVSGISHCIEHMVFKGTTTRCAKSIAEAFDRLGGHSNAYTTKEMTCFYATCLSQSLREAAELLSDMVINPKMSAKDLASERKVIFEEIDMCEDTPEDLVFELIARNSLQNCPAGRPILGIKKTLRYVSAAKLLEYLRTHYTGENVFIAVSGNFAAGDISYLEDLFSLIPQGKRNESKSTVYTPSLTVKRKQIEQVHLCIAYPALSSVDPNRFALRLMNTIFAEGMSSRLFQRLREQESLCYTVGGYPAAISDFGLYEIYTATGPENQLEAIKVITDEVERLLQDGVTEEELNRAKKMTEAGLYISLENTGARAELIAKNQMAFGTAPDMDKTLEKYRSVSREQIAELSRKIFCKNQASFAAVGDILRPDSYRNLL